MPFGRKINPEKDKGDENSEGSDRVSSSRIKAATSIVDQKGEVDSFTLYDSFFIDLEDDDHNQRGDRDRGPTVGEVDDHNNFADDYNHLPYFLQGYSLLHECITDYPTMEPKASPIFNHTRPSYSAVVRAINAAGLADSTDVTSSEQDTKKSDLKKNISAIFCSTAN